MTSGLCLASESIEFTLIFGALKARFTDRPFVSGADVGSDWIHREFFRTFHTSERFIWIGWGVMSHHGGKRMKSRLLSVSLGLGLVMALGAVPADAGGGGAGGKAARGKQKRPTPRPQAQPLQAVPKQVVAPNAVRSKTRSEVEFGTPIKFHNISIVPVTTKKIANFKRYTLIEQGFAKKTFAVRELKGNAGEAQVSHVEVRNKGEDPVYLLGGEMILGGKQDRIIAQDTVVASSGKWIKVDVFCVEQGRWQGQNMKFSSGKAMADVSIRRAAMSGSQSAVWSEVAKKNAVHGTSNKTQTYRRTIQKKALRNKIKPYVAELRRKLPKDKKLAGLVFGVNGKIHVADIFGNPVLFNDLSEKLLAAYVLEALGHKTNAKANAVSAEAAQGFISKGRRAKSKGVKKSGKARNISKEDDDFIGAETMDASDSEAAPSPIRESYIKKQKK